MEKHVVLASRNWSHPDITVDVTNLSIGVSMALDKFVEAMVIEAGNPAMLLTQKGLKDRLVAAAKTVCEKMKAETNRVM